MEEVDSIIIESLKNVNCDIDDDVTSLNAFTPDHVVSAIACCLESLQSGLQLPRRLPPSMSMRIKMASEFAERIQALGFRGDMGYQTILYCNAIEVRRVLMFLIERLPRDTNLHTGNSGATLDEHAYVPRLVREIEAKVRAELSSTWVDTRYLHDGAHLYSNDSFYHQSYGSSRPLRTDPLRVPKLASYYPSEAQSIDGADANGVEVSTDSYRNYCVHHLTDITRQTSSVLSSILHRDQELDDSYWNLFKTDSHDDADDVNIEHLSPSHPNHVVNLDKTQLQSQLDVNVKDVNANLETQLESAVKEYLLRQELAVTQEIELKKLQTDLSDLNTEKVNAEMKLKAAMDMYTVKNKTLAVLSKEENLVKLKELVTAGNERISKLEDQWHAVQSPLLEEYKTLTTSLSDHELKLKDEMGKLKLIVDKRLALQKQLVEKKALEQALIIECQSLNKTSNRAAYTKRIMEIIGNIKKQDVAIDKILQDTKEVQKNISNLSGQLSRSFTLSDELIFRDAKMDETARRAYKLLATLHEDCGHVVQAVGDVGALERETRNLEDQLDTELARDVASKLTRVQEDLAAVRIEIEQLAR